jgi:hypothetical protein
MGDADCTGGLHCAVSTMVDPIFAGGPANGYCTKPCQSAGDCPADSTCLGPDPNGLKECVLSCTLGPTLMYIDDPLKADKCLGREDVACTSLSAGGTACLPVCGSDSQCPSGTVCDPRSRVCVAANAMHTGDKWGAKCNSMAMPLTCAGTCVGFSGATMDAMCSSGCVLGGKLDGDDCGGLAKGICVFSASGTGAGDFGYCAPSCTAQNQCQNPGFWCFGINNVGSGNGWCFQGTPCPNGASDCSSVPNTTCTMTMYGAQCIDTKFPMTGPLPP